MQTGQEKTYCAVCESEITVFKDKSTDRVYCPVCQFPVDPDGPVPLDDIICHRFIEMVKKPALILFWAPWDKKSDEMYSMLAAESRYPKKNTILASINVAENPESRRHFGIDILPTFILMYFGRETNRIVGPISSFDLSRMMKQDYL